MTFRDHRSGTGIYGDRSGKGYGRCLRPAPRPAGRGVPGQWQANAAEIFYLAEYGADAMGGMSDGLIADLVQDDSPEYIGGTFVSPLAGGWKKTG